MSIIHVEPEILHEAARRIWQQRLLMHQEISVLRAALQRLEIAWQGADATEYIHIMHSQARQMERQLDQLDHLGLILHRQSERWQQSDETWRQIFSSQRYLPRED